MNGLKIKQVSVVILYSISDFFSIITIYLGQLLMHPAYSIVDV